MGHWVDSHYMVGMHRLWLLVESPASLIGSSLPWKTQQCRVQAQEEAHRHWDETSTSQGCLKQTGRNAAEPLFGVEVDLACTAVMAVVAAVVFFY